MSDSDLNENKDEISVPKEFVEKFTQVIEQKHQIESHYCVVDAENAFHEMWSDFSEEDKKFYELAVKTSDYNPQLNIENIPDIYSQFQELEKGYDVRKTYTPIFGGEGDFGRIHDMYHHSVHIREMNNRIIFDRALENANKANDISRIAM